MSAALASEPSVASRLQALVEELGAAIGRPVLLEDAALRPLAYSAHGGRSDPVRTGTLLERRAAEPVRRALMSQGIAQAREPLRIAADAHLGMEARVCVPVRHGGRTLGFIWLMDADLAPDALARTERAAAAAGAVLGGAQPAGRRLRDDGELLERLLSPDATTRRDAARAAAAGLGFEDGRLVACAVAAARPGDPERAWEQLSRLGGRLSSRHALAGRLADHCLLVLRTGEPALATCAPGELAGWVVGAAAGDGDLCAGQSGVVDGLAELARASDRALVALRTAVRRGVPSLAWDALGPDRVLGRLERTPLDDLPAGLRRLLTDPVLVETAACWLRHGGSVAATAAALPLHRSGVYYRLRRIEHATGLDLGDGDDRLLLQLALRLHGPPPPRGGGPRA